MLVVRLHFRSLEWLFNIVARVVVTRPFARLHSCHTPFVQAYCGGGGGGGAVDAFIGLTCEHAPLGSRATRPVRAAGEPSALDISGFSVSTAAPQSPAHIRQMRRDVFAPVAALRTRARCAREFDIVGLIE